MPNAQYTGRPKSAIGLTDRQKEYIGNKYQQMSVCTIASNIHVSAKLIYSYLNEKGWEAFDGRKSKKNIPEGEFFDWRCYNNDLSIG